MCYGRFVVVSHLPSAGEANVATRSRRTREPNLKLKISLMFAVGVGLIALGVGYAGLCVAQCAGRSWFVLRKPAIPPTSDQLRVGAAFGLVVAATPVLFGLWLLGITLSGNVGLGVWVAFIVVCIVGTAILRARRRRRDSSRPQV